MKPNKENNMEYSEYRSVCFEVIKNNYASENEFIDNDELIEIIDNQYHNITTRYEATQRGDHANFLEIIDTIVMVVEFSFMVYKFIKDINKTRKQINSSELILRELEKEKIVAIETEKKRIIIDNIMLTIK